MAKGHKLKIYTSGYEKNQVAIRVTVLVQIDCLLCADLPQRRRSDSERRFNLAVTCNFHFTTGLAPHCVAEVAITFDAAGIPKRLAVFAPDEIAEKASGFCFQSDSR